ncbi:transcriptional regulator, TetR family [Polaromonas sp. YR568]|uniref:TetR/AcrR family transcriptional regulator n=1 Tax=Polaromonas sp. YR568 TaxID=1855301 RepID=UPI0008E4E185|nr:TetR/AcrR family transcriptional regulator [Polaromonas sp. YR568]SFV02248.1 transcriptional regulator, TetR family [Polaromonas sp. YR568]
MDIPAPSPRERILLTAHDLFYRDGLRATGIDRIIAESGVAKLTFYRCFASKDELIRTFLDYRHERWMAWFVDALGRHGAVSGGGLAPLVPALGEWFADPLFRGCAFINAIAEVGNALPGVAAIVQNHKQDMQQVIAGLLPAGARQQALAAAAALAVDGAIVKAQMEGSEAALAGLRLLLDTLDVPT